MTLVLAVLAASLLGSVHCAGMCGGLVCFYAGGAAGTREARAWSPHIAYNAGRLGGYAVLGAAAGAIGGRLNQLGALAGLHRTAAILAGSLMVLWGATRLASQWGVRTPRLPIFGALQSGLGHAISGVRAWPATWRGSAIGVLTALLPCGWLYTFVATAGGTGSPVLGAMTMAVFWAGTLPVMLTLGIGLQRAAGPLQRRLPTIAAAAVVLIGLLSIAGRMHMGHVGQQ